MSLFLFQFPYNLVKYKHTPFNEVQLVPNIVHHWFSRLLATLRTRKVSKSEEIIIILIRKHHKEEEAKHSNMLDTIVPIILCS